MAALRNLLREAGIHRVVAYVITPDQFGILAGRPVPAEDLDNGLLAVPMVIDLQ